MPNYLTPTVPIEEIPTTPPPTGGAETSVCGFVGSALDGPSGQPFRVTSLAEAEQAFGGTEGWLTRAAVDFLAQGGTTAVLVRASGIEGLSALDAEDVSLLVVDPSVVDVASAYSWCEERRVFLVVDATDEGSMPPGLGRNAAAYFPTLLDADGVTRPSAPAVAGIYARNDRARGVWSSPAGRDAEVLVARPSLALDRDDVERLSAAQVNPLRDVGDGRLVVWGARTAAAESEWKYVAVRRMLLFLERSIDTGLQWVVFEPNDEPLWTRVREWVSDFLHAFWQQGALRGTASDDAFFVRCDRSTMTQDDIDNGRLVMMVGVAPVKPAEFVIFRIGQWTASRPDPDSAVRGRA